MAAASLTMTAGLIIGAAAPASAAGWCSTSVWVLEEWWPLVDPVYYVQVPSTSNTSYTYTNCEMDTGASGGGVKQLQRSLNACYGESLSVDGSYGSLTKAALKRAQTKEGMPTADRDGRYGPRTRDSIKHSGSGVCRKVDIVGGMPANDKP